MEIHSEDGYVTSRLSNAKIFATYKKDNAGALVATGGSVMSSIMNYTARDESSSLKEKELAMNYVWTPETIE